MGVIFEPGYSLPDGDQPLTHARIAHANNWLSGTAAASTTDSSYFEDGPDNSLTYEKWKPTALPATWEMDFGSVKDVDYCVIGAHTLGTAECTVKVEKWTGAAWADVTAATAIANDMEIMAIFATVNVSKMRIQVTTGTDNPTIGIVKFGEALQMPRPFYGGHAPLDLARQTVMRTNISETGEFLGRTKLRSSNNSVLPWRHIEAAWIRDNWKDFQKAIEEEPFFIAWRPSAFSEVALCDVQDSPVPSNMGIRDLMEVQVTVRARGYD
jgi:hypothetical protein